MSLTAATAPAAGFGAQLDAFFGTFLGRLVSCAIIVVVAFLLAWLLRLVIDRTVKRIVSQVKKSQNVEDTQLLAMTPVSAVRVVQRTRTLGSVLSNVANVTIAVIAIILVVNTLAPNVIGSLALLTAAVGAGLGFGAQNIVKDVLNGMFIVIEDQLGVGDVVDTGFATGVVESVGIRVTQIRDVNGTLWYVRNGEMIRVGNMSQGWARVIIDLSVPYDSEIDTVQDRMLEVARELASDARWRSRITDKPEIWGIQSISDDAIVLRVVVRTRSTAKDDVARELRARLKAALDELGVRIPSLASVVLQGFDHATNVGGSHPPRTKPLPAVAAEPAKPKRAPRARRGTPPATPPAGGTSHE